MTSMWLDADMAITRTGVARETARRMRRLDLQTGEDIRTAAAHAHHHEIARIEAATASPSWTS